MLYPNGKGRRLRIGHLEFDKPMNYLVNFFILMEPDCLWVYFLGISWGISWR